jgi:quercetin dioxygenase-like cupin family protein
MRPRDDEARADRQRGELIDCIAAGAPVRKLPSSRRSGIRGRHWPDHHAGVELAAIDAHLTGLYRSHAFWLAFGRIDERHEIVHRPEPIRSPSGHRTQCFTLSKRIRWPRNPDNQAANHGENVMDTLGFVVPPGQGKVWNMAPGRSAALKMLTGETAASVMMFEEVAPADTDTPLHLHHDSVEIAYVLSGEITFKIGDQTTVGGAGTCAFMPRGLAHAWKNTGTEPRARPIPSTRLPAPAVSSKRQLRSAAHSHL